MGPNSSHFQRFLRRVHRRLVVVRALERGGVGVVVAATVAIAVAGMMLWQGRDALPVASALLAIGAAVGFIWGVAHRPSEFDAAVEADRQLDLSDLLSSAHAARRSDDPWALAVIAHANERCRTLSPVSVVVHRYGGRAWTGIGLSAALGMTLATLSGAPRDVAAQQSDRVASIVTPREWKAPRDETSEPHASRSQSRNESRSETTDDLEAESTLSSRGQIDSSGERGDSGASAGQTSSASGEAPSANATGEKSRSGETASGGAAGRSDHDGDRAARAGSASATNPRSSPPWQTSSWSSDVTSATQAIRDGNIPAAYVDVVGAYFDRNPPRQP